MRVKKQEICSILKSGTCGACDFLIKGCCNYYSDYGPIADLYRFYEK